MCENMRLTDLWPTLLAFVWLQHFDMILTVVMLLLLPLVRRRLSGCHPAFSVGGLALKPA